MPLLTSCVTTKTKVVYVVPDMYWPEFPKPGADDVDYDKESDKVLMSLDYYEKIKNFKNLYRATKSTYESIRPLIFLLGVVSATLSKSSSICSV